MEEYVFYLTGFLTVLLLYVWLGEFWLAAYNVVDYRGEAKKVRRLLQFHPTSLILAAVLIGAAWFFKKHLALPGDQAGFPGYFTFLFGGAVAGGEFLSCCAAVHQLARAQPDAVLYAAGQPAVGGHLSRSLQLVELPASSDDGDFYWRVVLSAHRGSVCLDRCYVCHGNFI